MIVNAALSKFVLEKFNYSTLPYIRTESIAHSSKRGNFPNVRVLFRTLMPVHCPYTHPAGMRGVPALC
jgi:hypothetical protein